jgi:hypothetical protein
MRELPFLGTWEDSWQVLEAIIADGAFTMSPDKWYATPQSEVFRELTPELKDMLRERRRVYIWSPTYTRVPPVLERQEIGPKAGSYFIRLSKGGPGLELTLPACFKEDGPNLFLNYGSLTYPSLIQVSATGDWHKAPAALRDGFREVARRIQMRLVRHEDGNWIGPSARELFRSGRAQLVSRSKAHK